TFASQSEKGFYKKNSCVQSMKQEFNIANPPQTADDWIRAFPRLHCPDEPGNSERLPFESL
ncbi:MAG: hypothetical protein IJU53_05950, partial [Thermoguttaceae bacterium]|nr:hypothetical protein [Thermoguttaceae bacterium]